VAHIICVDIIVLQNDVFVPEPNTPYIVLNKPGGKGGVE